MNRLQIEGLSCRRGGRAVLHGVALTLDSGGVLLVKGSNGSGKSSLLRVLAGLLPCASGRILWNGAPIEDDASAWRRQVGYVGHQDALKPELTVGEMIAYWASMIGVIPPIHVLDELELSALTNRYIRQLSAGQKRRLALTRLLLREAPLWLLDEPLTALDAASQERVMALIARHRAAGGMVVMTAHHGVAMPDARQLNLPEIACAA